MFSNNYTTNSKLNAEILIDKEYVAIKLFEYGYSEKKGFLSTNYTVTILDDNGTQHKLSGTLYENGDRIYLNNKDLIKYISSNEKITIRIDENGRYSSDSSYLFEVERGNFVSVYNELNKSKPPAEPGVCTAPSRGDYWLSP